METLEGLTGLTEVSGDFTVGGMAELESLTGLNSLQVITGGLFLSSNNHLKRLNGLENLNELGSAHIGVTIFGNAALNPNLRDFCALQNVFTNGSYGNSININYNYYNPTVQDIIDGNCSL